jgi:hypothetical protein
VIYRIAFSTTPPRTDRGDPATKEERVIDAYLKHEAERKELGIPPRPLDPPRSDRLHRWGG